MEALSSRTWEIARRFLYRAENESYRYRSSVKFANLGGDAIMVAPTPLSTAPVYAHLAQFVRSAPLHQIQGDSKLVELEKSFLIKTNAFITLCYRLIIISIRQTYIITLSYSFQSFGSMLEAQPLRRLKKR